MRDKAGRAAVVLLVSVLKLLPAQSIAGVLSTVICSLARRFSPEESLIFLFDIENRLYEEQGRRAVAYGQGKHTKHRHTKYHDFFVKRLSKEDKVIDLGCGNGTLAYTIAAKVQCPIQAIDMSEANIRYARSHHSSDKIEYHLGDILQDLPQEEFDVIILSNVLEHLGNRSELLAELRTKLGVERFLIRVPLFERDWRIPLKKELGVEWRLDPTHETEYTIESFNEELDRAGLRVRYHEIRWGEIWAEVVSA